MSCLQNLTDILAPVWMLLIQLQALGCVMFDFILMYLIVYLVSFYVLSPIIIHCLRLSVTTQCILVVLQTLWLISGIVDTLLASWLWKFQLFDKMRFSFIILSFFFPPGSLYGIRHNASNDQVCWLCAKYILLSAYSLMCFRVFKPGCVKTTALLTLLEKNITSIS